MRLSGIYMPVTSTLLATVILAGTASAVVLEEVIVTAQKREQNLQDVGVSVTAFSGEQVRALGFTRSNDVMAQMPGVSFNSVASGGTFSLPTIRGVSQNDFSQTQEAPNAIYIDGIYMSFLTALNFALFDMERIEVLRGPQGTLYGRNATGGLFHYVTRKPTAEFEAYADLTYGSYDQIRSEAAISGSIAEGLSARLAFTSNHHDPWWENTAGEDRFDKDQYALRGHLLMEPDEDISLLLSVNAGAQNDLAGTYEGITGTADEFSRGVDTGGPHPWYGYEDVHEDAHKSAFNDVGFLDRKILSLAATLTWDFDDVTLTSISGYHDFEYEYREDCDGIPFEICEFGSGLSDAKQFSQEIRLNGDMDNLRWTFGGYYLSIDNDAFSSFEAPDFGGSPDAFHVVSDWETDTESWAVFGQVEFDFSPQLTLIAGLRWTEETKEHVAVTTCVDFPAVCAPGQVMYSFSDVNPLEVNPDTFLIGPPPDPALTKQDVGDWAGKIELDWRPGDDLLVYASVTRGNKGPGYNVPLDGLVGVGDTDFQEEVLVSYEVGFKSTLWDGRGRLNAAGFYYDYDDYQAFNLLGLTQFIQNRDAEMYGGEVELTLSPAEGWELLLGVSLLDAEVKDVPMPDLVTVLDVKPSQAPTVTINGLARKEWPMMNGMAAVQMDFNYVDDYYSGLVNAPTTHEDSYVIGNGRISYATGDGSWDIAMFVRNIANADIRNYTFDLQGFSATNLHSYQPPRWFGGQVRYTWQ